MALQIVELSPRIHDRASFDCGNPGRNNYLHQLAMQHRRNGFSTTFVLSDSESPAAIIGYYSLSAAQIDLGVLPEKERKKLPPLPVPAARLGQLAVNLDHQGQGFGALLLQHAVKRAIATRELAMGVHLVIVDADSRNAADFYRKFGFRDCNSKANVLFLCLGRI